MTLPDANGWIAGMDSAAKLDDHLVLIPDPDANGDYFHAIAQWDEGEQRWVGEWRHFCDGETGEELAICQQDPTHYKVLDLPVALATEAAA